MPVGKKDLVEFVQHGQELQLKGEIVAGEFAGIELVCSLVEIDPDPAQLLINRRLDRRMADGWKSAGEDLLTNPLGREHAAGGSPLEYLLLFVGGEMKIELGRSPFAIGFPGATHIIDTRTK